MATKVSVARVPAGSVDLWSTHLSLLGKRLTGGRPGGPEAHAANLSRYVSQTDRLPTVTKPSSRLHAMEIPVFYPIIDTQVLAQAGLTPLEMARALARAQASLVQFRHKGVYTREILAQAEEVGKIVRQSGARYIINDRADIALMLAADGVHVGQDDLPPAKVRKLVGEGMILGFSTHNEQQLRDGDREPVDYLALGPVFGTPSKQNPDPVVGAAELTRLKAFTKKPLVAIGGITRANAREVLAAGANSLAVISDAVGPNLDARLAEWILLTTG